MIILVYLKVNLLVGLDGFEPSILRLSAVRFNQLSYKPICMAEGDRFELPSPVLETGILPLN